jgi:hypothetical protein
LAFILASSFSVINLNFKFSAIEATAKAQEVNMSVINVHLLELDLRSAPPAPKVIAVTVTALPNNQFTQ